MTIAEILLRSGALKISPDQPFKLTSGLFSPFYIDCRLIIGDAAARCAIGDALAEKARTIGLHAFDIVAGGVTAGVPFATMVADRLQKPLVYIRPEPKAHGTGSQIEGGDVAGKRVLLIEDLLNNAASVQKFHPVLKAAGATIDHLLVIVSRANEAALEKVKNLSLSLHALVDIDSIVIALEDNPETKNQASVIRNFLTNPDEWSQNRY